VLTGTLRNDLEAEFASLHRPARKVAVLGLPKYGERDAARALPTECPYALDDILLDDWYPANRHGIVDPD
jgi:hypothetical protein